MTLASRKPALSALLVLSMVIAGCAGPGLKRDGAQPEPSETLATKLEHQGDLRAAADMYRQLADGASPPARTRFQIQAARLLLGIPENGQAKKLLAKIDREELTPELQLRVEMLEARSDMLSGRVDAALSLQLPSSAHLPVDIGIQYHRLRAEALRIAGNPLDSAAERVLLDTLLTDAVDIENNQRALLETLSTLSSSALQTLGPSTPATLAAWMELALVIKDYQQNPAQVTASIRAWRHRYPEHPAGDELLEAYAVRITDAYQAPRQIALVLPRTGRFARAADTIQEGFLAAYYMQREESRPALRIYEITQPDDAWSIYNRALAEGADVLVGPLRKDAVSALASSGRFDVPVLTLNYALHTPAEAPENLFQFGLAPEDEARQAADRAWLDGHSRALAMVPRGEWGDRAVEAFRQQWEMLGGTLLETAHYLPRKSDYSAPISALLNLDQSKQRLRQLRRVIGTKVEYEPYRRQDAELIFLVASPREARLVRPQLQFHHAEELPVYATSQVFDGSWTGKRDSDLEGIAFCDLPWFLNEDGGSPLSITSARKLWPDISTTRLRLLAMGADAYNLLPHLQRLRDNPGEGFAGKTGNLYVQRNGKIHRQLVWARFERGVPRVIGYSPDITQLNRTPVDTHMAPVDPAAPVLLP